MSNQTFKKGDRVFCIIYGWGTISQISKGHFPIDIEFDCNVINSYTIDGRITQGGSKTLSFTEYTLEGFSQERPEELPTKGQIVWVRDGKKFNWEVYHFLKHIPNAAYPYMVAQDCNEDNFEAFKYLTTINPYTNEK